MKAPLKVLIAYDGSASAEAAIADLKRAGLSDTVEALVLTAADLWILPPGDAPAPPQLLHSTTNRQARAAATAMLEIATIHATHAASLVRQHFPSWNVTSEVVANSPAWAITLKAEEWGADLIVIGSQGHSQVGRWLLGSVSQAVLTHSDCSVRIARGRPTPANRPLRILVGVDGSLEADLAVRTVASRNWPAGTDIRLMMVLNPTMLAELNSESQIIRQLESNVSASGDALHPDAEFHVEKSEPVEDIEVEKLDGMIGRMMEGYVATVQQNPSGATVQSILVSGDPKRVLIDHANEWGADCIFIGSRGLNQWERLLLGSVSSAVAVRATCPVEVIRRPIGGATAE